MADSILRLKVESQEYDSKIQRAAKGLLEFENSCRKAGGTLAYLDKEEQDFVRSLGSMDTVSTTTRGKLNELTQAFTDLSIQYKRLTDEEKKGDYGKALSASLDQLKGRIQETRADLNGVTASLGDTAKSGNGLSQMLDGIASKFGLNVGQLTKFGGALAAASAAIKVAKDSFTASEANIDEWGRTVRSAQDVYEGFLTSLNTGDVSGFLSRIGEIIGAARDAYTELDRLGTMKKINVPRLAEQQIENERLRAILRTGRQINRADDANPSVANGTQLTKQQLEVVSKQLESGLANYNNIIREEIEQSNVAIEDLYEEQATILGMSKDEFRAGTATMAALEQRIANAKKYNEFESQHTKTTTFSNNFGTYSQNTRDNVVNPYVQYKGWDVFKDDGPLFQRLTELIQQRASLTMQSYSNTAGMYRQINRAQGVAPYSGRGAESSEQTELQKNSAAIEKLKQEYIDLASTAQTASESELVTIRDRQTAIQNDIRTLQERNDEIKRLGQEAAGVKLGRLPELNEQLKQLRTAQGNVSTFAEFRDLEQRIRSVNAEIVTLTGNLPKGEALTFTVTVDAEQAKAIMDELADDKDVHVNVVEGETAYIDIPEDDITRTIDIVVNDSDALRQIAEMETVTFDPKTIEFTANDADVFRAVQQVQGVKIGEKPLTVIPETADALKALADVQGLTIAPKSFPVTASTDEALRQLQAIADVTIQSKEVRVDEVTGKQYTHPTLKPMEQVVNEVTGEHYVTPVLPTVEQRVNHVAGDTYQSAELPDQTIHVGYEVEETPDVELSGEEVTRSIDIVVNDSEALRQIAEMETVTFDPKTVEFTANDVDVLRAVQHVQGVKIGEKPLTVIPETADALKALADVQGMTIAPKSFPVTATTDEALRQLQAVAGVTIQPKEVRVDEVTGKTYTAPTLPTIEQRIDQVTGKTYTSPSLPAVEQRIDQVGGKTYTPPTLKPTEQVVNEVTGERYAAPVLPSVEQRVNQVAGDTYQPAELPDQTIHVGYEVEETPDVELSDEEVTRTIDIVVNDSEALRQIAEMETVTFDPKTVEFKANDADVLRAVQQVQGVKIGEKPLIVIPETTEALLALSNIQGLTISPKSFPVTASTDEVLRQLQAIAGVTIQPKEVRVDEVTGKTYTAPTLPTIEQRVNQVAGDTYQSSELPDQTIHVGYEVEEVPDIDIPDDDITRTIDIEVNDPDDINKEVVVGIDDSQAVTGMEQLNNQQLQPKTITITANTDAAVQKVLGATEGMARSDIKLQTPEVTIDSKALFNSVNLEAKIKDIKQQLTQAEFGSDLYQSLTARLADATALSNLISEYVKRGIDMAEFDGTPIWESIFGDEDVAQSELEERLKQLNDYMKQHGLKPLKLDVQTGNVTEVADTGKLTGEAWKSAAQAIQAVGGAIAQIEDPAEKVAGTIAQAVATMALSYAQASAAAASNPANAGWGWVAFAATGLATMLSSIEAIKKATAGSYENGGIVPGNSFHGDHLTAAVNSGELILNKSQQDSIAAQLYSNSNNAAVGELTAVVTGEQLRLVLNNHGRRTGRGEYVQTHFSHGS